MIKFAKKEAFSMSVLMWIGIFVAVFIGGIGVFISYYFGEKKNKK